MRRLDVCPGEERRTLRKGALCSHSVTKKRTLAAEPRGTRPSSSPRTSDPRPQGQRKSPALPCETPRKWLLSAIIVSREALGGQIGDPSRMRASERRVSRHFRRVDSANGVRLSSPFPHARASAASDYATVLAELVIPHACAPRNVHIHESFACAILVRC